MCIFRAFLNCLGFSGMRGCGGAIGQQLGVPHVQLGGDGRGAQKMKRQGRKGGEGALQDPRSGGGGGGVGDRWGEESARRRAPARVRPSTPSQPTFCIGDQQTHNNKLRQTTTSYKTTPNGHKLRQTTTQQQTKQDGYAWWRSRLAHMAQYFHAYR